MFTCIYTKRECEDSPGEHILQNSFGARWTSKSIACAEVQNMFGGTIDADVEQAFQALRNLLGAKGGRGDTGPILKAEDTDGRKFRLLPGGKPELQEPNVEVSESPNGQLSIRFELAHMGQLEWAKAKFRAMYPGRTLKFDVSISPVKESDYLQKPLRLSLVVGGDGFFRGLLKSAFNLLGTVKPKLALTDAFDALRDFVVEGKGDAKNFVRWSPDSTPFLQTHLGEFDHFIGVWCLGGQVFATASLYGGIPFLFRLTEQPVGENFTIGYLVDPLRMADPPEKREIPFDPAKFPAFLEGRSEPGSEIWAAFVTRVEAFLQNALCRADELRIKEIVNEVLSPHEGEVLDQATATELLQKLQKYVEHRMGCH